MFAASLSVFLIALLGAIEYFLARPYLHPDPYESVRYLVLIGLLSVSLLLAIIALLVHRFKPFPIPAILFVLVAISAIMIQRESTTAIF